MAEPPQPDPAKATNVYREPVLHMARAEVSMMPDIQHAWKHVEVHQGQVVVVVPPDRHQVAQEALVAYAGARHPFSGRTVRLPNGGRVSVVSSQEEVFKGVFAVMFVGVLETGDLTRWKDAAQQVL